MLVNQRKAIRTNSDKPRHRLDTNKMTIQTNEDAELDAAKAIETSIRKGTMQGGIS